MDDNRYKKVEGLLFSYKSLPYKKKCLEIDLKIDPNNEAKINELEKVTLTMNKIDSMLEMVRVDSESDYLILKLWYIERMTWEQISSQLHMSISWLIKKRREIIIDKLLMIV